MTNRRTNRHQMDRNTNMITDGTIYFLSRTDELTWLQTESYYPWLQMEQMDRNTNMVTDGILLTLVTD